MLTAVATIEREETWEKPRPHLRLVESGPTIKRVDLLAGDEQIKQTAETFIGDVALRSVVEVEVIDEEKTESLLDSLKKAKKGNEQAKQSARMNVKLALIEGVYKSGHISEVKSEIDENGHPIQLGQSHRKVQKNALLYAVRSDEMKERTDFETHNAFRIEEYIAKGLLKDHWLLVPSLFADNISTEQAREEGFFTQYMTGMFQASTLKDGMLVTESAYVAGVDEELDEKAEVLDQPRADKNAVAEIYEELDVKLEDDFTTTELLDKGLLIPKSLMPNGVIDFVEYLDQKRGGTFFGQISKGQTYEGFKELCEKREAGFDDLIDKILDKLIDASDGMAKPIEAIDMLYELVKQDVIEEAVMNPNIDIDITIFGSAAAEKIVQARVLRDRGEIHAMQNLINQATDEAIFTMCGDGGKKKKGDNSSEELDQKNPAENADVLEKTEDDKSGKIRCFKCKQMVDKKDVVKEDTWCCPKCHYEVDVCDGTVVNEGNVKAEDKSEDAVIIHLEDVFKQKQVDNKRHE